MYINMTISERLMNYVLDWEYEKYLLIGGYGSGKSQSTAQKIILKLLQEKRTCLVVRNVFTTIKDSCFTLFETIVSEMGMISYSDRQDGIVFVKSPMEIRFPNGSRIIFRGMDNKEKIKSIYGVSIIWIEECSEINESIYNELLGRMRQPGVTLHCIMTCNPISRTNWVYNTFFERKIINIDEYGNQTEKKIKIQDEKEFYDRRTLIGKTNGVYYHHSTADDNMFLPKSYITNLDNLKTIDPELYEVARKGRFGAIGLRVLPNFIVATDSKQFRNAVNNITSQYHFFGFDFGFETSYNALVSCCVDDVHKILYIYDEIYMNHITDDLFCELPSVQKTKHRTEQCNKYIYADSSEPKTIQYYRQQGFKIAKCKKYPGSRLENTRKLKRFKKIVCSPKCVNTIKELSELTYAKDKNGELILDKFNIDSHVMSALWYALDKYEVSDYKKQPNTQAG